MKKDHFLLHYKNYDKIALTIVLTYTIAYILILTIQSWSGSNPVDQQDIRNWVSLIIEVGLAVIITVVVVVYSDHQQQKLNQLVEEIKKMENSQIDIEKKLLDIIEKQEKFTTKKRNQAYTGLNGNIFALRFSIRHLEREFGWFHEGKMPKEEYLEQIQKMLPHVKISVDNLQNYCDANEQYLDEEVLSGIHRLVVEGQVYCEMGVESRESFNPTTGYPDLVNQIWNEVPDPYDGYSKLKTLYGWNSQ